VFSTHAISASVPAAARSGKFIVHTKSGSTTSKVALAVIPFHHA
jgi:hypothetical protein